MKRVIAGVCLCWVAACAPPEVTGPSLRARSAGDLHCPAASLKIYQLDQLSYRVVGCGQDTVYISVCEVLPVQSTLHSALQCTWAMDSTRGASRSPRHPDNASTPATPQAGCSFDTQCKGDRICSAGQCVAPPAPPAP